MSEFVEYVHEVLAPLGPIRSRKMFGGYGIYHQDLMFGLVADDELYFKVDAESKPLFLEHDLGPFEYNKDGKIMPMSYHRAPEEIYDDPEQAQIWAEIGFAAALRANAVKLKKAASKGVRKKTKKKSKKKASKK